MIFTPTGPALQFEDAAGDTVTVGQAATDEPTLALEGAPGGIWLTREQAGVLAGVLARWAQSGRLEDA